MKVVNKYDEYANSLDIPPAKAKPTNFIPISSHKPNHININMNVNMNVNMNKSNTVLPGKQYYKQPFNGVNVVLPNDKTVFVNGNIGNSGKKYGQAFNGVNSVLPIRK
ncbi:hypothetical protein Catovirus_1_971 [Catovirus CTV1]|uniref:Uncharacterized protein n=1 Tax=Catovirus CTV1 TaxID=1977631 RepID=A0A1V0SB63_9VIRU|nr:hypothetical protein Catovirus_1_971 [Catovirus CTV1]